MSPRPFYFCMTVDDVAYDGYSTEADVEKLLAFFAEEEVSCTFFVVPRGQGREFGTRTGYVELMKQAQDQGHEVAQHGLEHQRFECGIPPEMILNMEHERPNREYYVANREAIHASLAVTSIRGVLAAGRSILEEALQVPIVGYRSPCLQTCTAMYEALRDEGYAYDSSHYLQPAGWALLNSGKSTPQPITRPQWDACQQDGLQTVPLTTEYTWYLTRETYDATLALARHDLLACMDAGIPFVPVSHVSPIQEGADNCGLQFYRELLNVARDETARRELQLQCVSLTSLTEETSLGARIYP